MSYMHLHDDVWEMIGNEATIDSIESLGLTCRHLHELMSRLSIWREVTQDLLALSPNPLLELSLPTASARTLRTKALRFRDVHRDLCAGSAARMRSVKRLGLQACAGCGPVHLLPGTACILYGAALEDGSAAYHLMSLLTGSVVDTLPIPDVISTMPGVRSVCASPKWGFVAVAVLHLKEDAELGDYLGCRPGDRALQLLRIEPVSGLRLVHLLCVRLHKWMWHPDSLGWHDERLMVAWLGYGQPCLDIIDVAAAEVAGVAGVEPGASALRHRWTLPDDCALEHGGGATAQIAARDTALFCKPTASGTVLHVLHLPPACAPEWAARAETVRRVDFGAAPSWGPGDVRAVRGPGMAADVVFWHHASAVHLDGLEHLTDPAMSEDGVRRISAFDCGPAWVCAVVAAAGAEKQTLRIAPRRGAGAVERLDAQPSGAVTLEMKHVPEDWIGMCFDEWSGVGIMTHGFHELEGADVFVV